MELKEQVMWCVTLYKEQWATLDVPNQMLNRFWHNRNYFFLEASRDWKIVEEVVEKIEKIMSYKTLYHEEHWFAKMDRDILKSILSSLPIQKKFSKEYVWNSMKEPFIILLYNNGK